MLIPRARAVFTLAVFWLALSHLPFLRVPASLLDTLTQPTKDTEGREQDQVADCLSSWEETDTRQREV